MQNGAACAENPRGGLQDTHDHQPFLLRSVQFVLHTEEPETAQSTPARRGGDGGRGPERAVVQVVLVLQAEKVHLGHRDAGMSRFGDEDSQETHTEDQTMQMRRSRCQLGREVGPTSA